MSDHVSFGDFRFEPLTARLWQGEREIKLTRKAAAVLALLLIARGSQWLSRSCLHPYGATRL